MVKEAIERVYNAEEESQRIIEDAKHQAELIVKKAKTVAESIIKAQKKDAKLKAEKRLIFSENSQRHVRDKIIEKSTQEAEGLKRNAQAKSSEVINIVIKAIAE